MKQKGFFGSLFDLSFTSFVTPKLIKILFVLTLVILVIAYIVIAISIFSSGGSEVTIEGGQVTTEETNNTGAGLLFVFVGGPLMLFFYTLLYRVLFELIMVIFRIYENTAVLAQAAGGGAVSAAPTGPPAPAPSAPPSAPPAGPESPGTLPG